MSTLILCFHRVADPRFGGQSLLAISPDDFANVLDQVGRTRDFVSLDEASRHSTTPRAVVTFDDGYLDNLTNALPLIEAREIPVTFFLSTGFIDSPVLFPPDALDGLCGDTEHMLTPELEDLVSGGYWNALERLAAAPAQQYWQMLDSASALVREEILGNDPTRRPMTLAEVRELASSSLASIGPHTVSHRRLSALPSEDAASEIRNSARWFIDHGLTPTPYFAYPFGQRADMCQELSSEIRRIGFEPMTTLPTTDSARTRRALGRLGVSRLSVGPLEVQQFGFLARALPRASILPRLWLYLLSVRRHLLRSSG